MRKRTTTRKIQLLCLAALVCTATAVQAQKKMRPGTGATWGSPDSSGSPTPPTPAPAAAQPGAGAPPAPAAPAAAPPTTPAQPKVGDPPAPTAGGRAQGDTSKLPQFQGLEFEPLPPHKKVAFSLEDADLAELVRTIGEITGKRFIFGAKVKTGIKATVLCPQKVTVAEAYQAFLSILETNGLTVVPQGRFLKIVETQGVASQTPIYPSGQAATAEDRFITRLHRLSHVSAEEASGVLTKFKSAGGDITSYGPGNLLIITDTGMNIRRMMQIVEEIDVGGAGDQIWIESIHYSAASDVEKQLSSIFDLRDKGAAPAAGGKGAAAASSGAGDMHIAKIVADDRSNSIIIVATERAYLRVLEFIKRIDVPRSGEGEIHVLALQHADAEQLSKTLNDVISGAAQAQNQPAGGGGAGGSKPSVQLSGIFEATVKVSADKATNSIVITSSLRDYAALRAVIDKLDQPRRQVFIEAVIMDLTIDRQNQLGFAFHGGAVETSPIGTGNSIIYGGLNALKTLTTPSPTDLQALALGVRGPGLPGSEVFGLGPSIPAFGLLINALASTSDADILSTPHILATDNEQAEISVGQNIATQQNFAGLGGIPNLGAQGAQGAQGASALGALGALGGFGGIAPRQDVGTKITIKPHLNDSNEVRLELKEEISDATGQPQGTLGVVPISKRTANTQLVIKDQQTVVIGGLMRNRIARGQTKIPLLGDIPVLGALFRSSSNAMQKSNLILVLTPYIIRDQTDLRTIFERKMQERQEFIDHYFVFNEENDYHPPLDYSRTAGLLEEIRQGYRGVEERRKLDELARPREIKGHEPGQPIEMPATSRMQSSSGAASGAATPAPPENVNVKSPARSIDKVER